MKVYYIRHGETEWSRSGQHTGRTDIALTAAGEEEARRLGPMLQGVQFDHVLVSPRMRARRTYELSGITTAAETDPDLAEWDYGDYEGRRSVDIHAERPGWEIFRDGCSGGESPTGIAVRADRLIARVRSSGGSVALFAHGHIGSVLAARWIGQPVLVGQHLWLATGSLSVLGDHPSHPGLPVIARWNLAPQAG